MAIDIRATVNCTLGTLISGSVNDDYIQGSGLVKTRGSVELSGLVAPAIGTAVEFSYTRGGITTYLPRKLRVLSSFADPYRRTTRVELGCKLTYLADKKEPLKWDAFDDPINQSFSASAGPSSGYSEPWGYLPSASDKDKAVIPMNAKSIMAKCLTELGITASSNPLTSRFSREEFDYSPGYVQILSDLLISENFVGYLNRSEVLQIISLDQDGGTGPVVTREKIIDLGSIGAGQLPGEAVVVNYTTYRTKYDESSDVPDPTNPQDGAPSWTYSSNSSRDEARIRYTIPGTTNQAEAVYPTLTTETVRTTYDQRTTPTGERINVVQSRVSTRSVSAAAIAGEIATGRLSAGVGFSNSSISEVTTEAYSYDDYGNPTLTITEKTGTGFHVAGAVGLPMVLPDGSVVTPNYGGSFPLERQEVEVQRIGSATQTTTRTYVPWYRTIAGQQSIAASRDSFTTAGQVASYVNSIASSLHLQKVTVQTDTSGYRGQRGPAQSDVPASVGADPSASPDSNWRVESEANLNLALGSATAQRRIELSLPYAADDVFFGFSTGGGGGGGTTMRVRKGPAATQATNFGRVQNKLLAGNRNGMSLQCAVGTLPNQPFGPFVVEANGLSALYRTNGSGWTFDANGIIHSTDALFWGAIGGTGDFWFPVAPGITTLPTAPAVVDTTPTAMLGSVSTVGSTAQATLSAAFPSATTGQGALDQATGNVYTKDASGNWVNVGPNPGPTVTAPAVVPVWNETLELSAKIRLGATVTSLGYALTLPTITLSPKVRVRATVRAVVQVNPPTTDLVITPLVPVIRVNVPLPVTTLEVSTLGPVVEQAGVNVPLPVAELSLSGVAPVIDSPGSVILPTANLELSGVAPVVAQIGGDPSWASVSLLLSFDGTNGSTTITDKSSNANTISVFGAAAITTADKKYGTGSLNINNSAGAYVQTPASALFQFGTGDFTVEFWANPASNQGNQGLFTFGGTSTGLFLAIFGGNWMLGTTGSGGSSMGAAATGWQHVAITRSGTSLRLFINGNQAGGTLTNSTNLSDNQLKIGYYFNTSYPFNGKHDEFRVTKGVARYTGNFTPPAAPFPEG